MQIFIYSARHVSTVAVQHTTRTHSPRDRLLTTPRTYAAFVIKPLFAPEDGRIGPKHVELNK